MCLTAYDSSLQALARTDVEMQYGRPLEQSKLQCERVAVCHYTV